MLCDKPQGSHQYHIFVDVWRVSFQLAGDDQHRFQRSQPEIVVRLFRQLFPGQLIQNGHFFCQHFGVQKSFRKQHDQTNKFQVGRYAYDRPEERFHGFRQFGTAGVTGVHRDEYADLGVQLDVSAPELTRLSCRVQMT